MYALQMNQDEPKPQRLFEYSSELFKFEWDSDSRLVFGYIF